MDQKQIDEILGAMPNAGCDASDFRDAVWREILHRRALGEMSRSSADVWFLTLRGIFAPTAIAGLAAAALVAWVVGSSWEAPEDHRTGTTARILDLGVFGPNADGLAHGRLVVNR